MPADQTTAATWRCRMGHGLFARNQLYTRRGLLECPACLPRGTVGSLVPGHYVRCRRCTDYCAGPVCVGCEADGGPTIHLPERAHA